ncbi:unnamed protein product [Discosporangium mesarthrocarpum]
MVQRLEQIWKALHPGSVSGTGEGTIRAAITQVGGQKHQGSSLRGKSPTIPQPPLHPPQQMEEVPGTLAARVQAVIEGNQQLYEDILLFQTIDLSATQRLVQDSGVKCSKRALGLYLDEMGVTFVDRGQQVKAQKGSSNSLGTAPGKGVSTVSNQPSSISRGKQCPCSPLPLALQSSPLEVP